MLLVKLIDCDASSTIIALYAVQLIEYSPDVNSKVARVEMSEYDLRVLTLVGDVGTAFDCVGSNIAIDPGSLSLSSDCLEFFSPD
jgi:hypothetical protein